MGEYAEEEGRVGRRTGKKRVKQEWRGGGGEEEGIPSPTSPQELRSKFSLECLVNVFLFFSF